MALNVKPWETKGHPEVSYPPRSLTAGSSSKQEEDVLDRHFDKDYQKRMTDRILSLAEIKKERELRKKLLDIY